MEIKKGFKIYVIKLMIIYLYKRKVVPTTGHIQYVHTIIEYCFFFQNIKTHLNGILLMVSGRENTYFSGYLHFPVLVLNILGNSE